MIRGRQKGHVLELLYGAAALLYVRLMATLTLSLYRVALANWIRSVASAEVATALAYAAAVAVVLLAGLSVIGDIRTDAAGREARYEFLGAALDDWRKALGAENVVDDLENRRAAERATFATSALIPALIRPGSREDVQECVRIARKHGVPIYSSQSRLQLGVRLARAACRRLRRHGVGRLDRIRAFDEALAYVTVGPGVTPGMLHEFLEQRGSRLNLPVVGSSVRASLVGNALERGAGAGPGGYRADNVCDLEIVLPDGCSFLTLASLRAPRGSRTICGSWIRWAVLSVELRRRYSDDVLADVAGAHPKSAISRPKARKLCLALSSEGLRGLFSARRHPTLFQHPQRLSDARGAPAISLGCAGWPHAVSALAARAN